MIFLCYTFCDMVPHFVLYYEKEIHNLVAYDKDGNYNKPDAHWNIFIRLLNSKNIIQSLNRAN